MTLSEILVRIVFGIGVTALLLILLVVLLIVDNRVQLHGGDTEEGRRQRAQIREFVREKQARGR